MGITSRITMTPERLAAMLADLRKGQPAMATEDYARSTAQSVAKSAAEQTATTALQQAQQAAALEHAALADAIAALGRRVDALSSRLQWTELGRAAIPAIAVGKTVPVVVTWKRAAPSADYNYSEVIVGASGLNAVFKAKTETTITYDLTAPLGLSVNVAQLLVLGAR